MVEVKTKLDICVIVKYTFDIENGCRIFIFILYNYSLLSGVFFIKLSLCIKHVFDHF